METKNLDLRTFKKWLRQRMETVVGRYADGQEQAWNEFHV